MAGRKVLARAGDAAAAKGCSAGESLPPPPPAHPKGSSSPARQPWLALTSLPGWLRKGSSGRRGAAGELPSFVRFPAAQGETLQRSHSPCCNFPFNWFLDAFLLNRQIKTLLLNPSAPALLLSAAARHRDACTVTSPTQPSPRSAGSSARSPPVSPVTALLTPRAEHPPGESGRGKSRAALDMEKSHVNQCAPPQLFPFGCTGVPVSPSPDAGTGPPAEGL